MTLVRAERNRYLFGLAFSYWAQRGMFVALCVFVPLFSRSAVGVEISVKPVSGEIAVGEPLALELEYRFLETEVRQNRKFVYVLGTVEPTLVKTLARGGAPAENQSPVVTRQSDLWLWRDLPDSPFRRVPFLSSVTWRGKDTDLRRDTQNVWLLGQVPPTNIAKKDELICPVGWQEPFLLPGEYVFHWSIMLATTVDELKDHELPPKEFQHESKGEFRVNVQHERAESLGLEVKLNPIEMAIMRQKQLDVAKTMAIVAITNIGQDNIHAELQLEKLRFRIVNFEGDYDTFRVPWQRAPYGNHAAGLQSSDEFPLLPERPGQGTFVEVDISRYLGIESPGCYTAVLEIPISLQGSGQKQRRERTYYSLFNIFVRDGRNHDQK